MAEASFDASEMIGSLGGVAEALEIKANEQSHGVFRHRVENPLEYLHDREAKLFEEPTTERFLRAVQYLGAVYIPDLATERTIKRSIPFETAYRESVEAGFIARQRLVTEITQNPKSEKYAEEIIATHLLLSHYELSEDLVTQGNAVSKTQFYMTRSMIFGAAVSYGARNPMEFEQIALNIRNTIRRKSDRFEGYTAEIKELSGDSDYRGSARDFLRNRASLLEAESHGFNTTLFGARAEIMCELMTQNILKNRAGGGRLTQYLNNSGYKNVRLERANQEIDTFGIADYYLCGDLNGSSDVILALEVKTSGDRSLTVGVLTKVRSDRADDAGGINAGDSDPAKKRTPRASDSFVRETGIPVVGVRIPNTWILDSMGRTFYEGDLVKDLAGIVEARYGTEAEKKGVRDSIDMLENALLVCSKKGGSNNAE